MRHYATVICGIGSARDTYLVACTDHICPTKLWPAQVAPNQTPPTVLRMVTSISVGENLMQYKPMVVHRRRVGEEILTIVKY